jgi:hypothetical protein
MLQKLTSDNRADGVASAVFGACCATPVSVETRDGVRTTGFQLSTKDVSINHESSIAASGHLHFRKDALH